MCVCVCVCVCVGLVLLCIIVCYLKGMYECVYVFVLYCLIVLYCYHIIVLHNVWRLERIQIGAIEISFWFDFDYNEFAHLRHFQLPRGGFLG